MNIGQSFYFCPSDTSPGTTKQQKRCWCHSVWVCGVHCYLNMRSFLNRICYLSLETWRPCNADNFVTPGTLIFIVKFKGSTVVFKNPAPISTCCFLLLFFFFLYASLTLGSNIIFPIGSLERQLG